MKKITVLCMVIIMITGSCSKLKHFRKLYITQEDLFVNGLISMQHTSYVITAKHYIDRKEIAKQMARQGFRIFPKRNSG